MQSTFNANQTLLSTRIKLFITQELGRRLHLKCKGRRRSLKSKMEQTDRQAENLGFHILFILKGGVGFSSIRPLNRGKLLLLSHFRYFECSFFQHSLVSYLQCNKEDTFSQSAISCSYGSMQNSSMYHSLIIILNSQNEKTKKERQQTLKKERIQIMVFCWRGKKKCVYIHLLSTVSITSSFFIMVSPW